MKKIKICGLKRREDIEYVNKYQPDYIGFVFAGKKRKLTYDQVVDLKKYLTSSIQVVGVFVNEDISFVIQTKPPASHLQNTRQPQLPQKKDNPVPEKPLNFASVIQPYSHK